jgi:hypothetical protein
MEMDEMEGLRIQSELDKLRGSWSSLADVPNNNNGVISSLIDYPTNKRDRPLSRTLSNSLLDMALPMGSPSTCMLISIELKYLFKFFFVYLIVNHHTKMTNTSEVLPCRNSQCSVDSGMVINRECYLENNDHVLFTTKKCPFEMILWLLSGCG